jgi:predicted transcriptional regulator
LYPLRHRDRDDGGDLLLPVGSDGYTMGMKTAISIPDDVFADAERLAKTLKQSRSQLYSRAVREYVARHAADQVTEALDLLCADEDVLGEGFVAEAARRTLAQSEW